jgi:hypothetical protein
MAIRRLCIFDFDETLVRAPGYTDKKAVERLHPDIEFPTPYSFYDHPLSLDEEIHNIQAISPVVDDLNEANRDVSTVTVLITHRVTRVAREVEKILDSKNLKFDRKVFLGRQSEKSEILAQELRHNPKVEVIAIYEDSFEQIAKYNDFLESKKFQGTVEYYLVDKSKVIKLYSFFRGRTRRITLL